MHLRSLRDSPASATMQLRLAYPSPEDTLRQRCKARHTYRVSVITIPKHVLTARAQQTHSHRGSTLDSLP